MNHNQHLTQIPVLGTAVVNGASWLRDQIASIDMPVDRYVVVNNSGLAAVANELREIINTPNDFIRQRHVIDLPGNIGCAGAWNLMIKTTMMSPYWVICNHDVSFVPGVLAAIHQHMTDGRTGLVHGSSGDFAVGSWDLFAISERVVASHGLFDENFYPAYVEDLDYLMRLMNQPVPRVMLDMPYLHGGAPNSDYNRTGSQSLRSDSELKQRVDHARWINENRYMVDKWGPDWRWVMTHKQPWNQPTNSQGSWTWDLEFVRSKYTGF